MRAASAIPHRLAQILLVPVLGVAAEFPSRIATVDSRDVARLARSLLMRAASVAELPNCGVAHEMGRCFEPLPVTTLAEGNPGQIRTQVVIDTARGTTRDR